MSQKNFSSYDNLISLFTSIKNKITAIRNESSQLIKDTNGWIGKNLLVTPYYHGTSREDAGITYTVDGTGRVTADGTASNWSSFWLENEFKVKAGTYILTGIPETENEVYIAFEYGGTTHETITKDIRSTRIRFNNDTTVLIRITIKTGETVNNLVFEPMLRLASISDDTYEPYHEDVARFVDTKAEQWLNGAVGWTGKQLIPFPYYEMSLERDGVTFTVNSDGSVTLQTDSNGATANASLILMQNTTLLNDKAVHCLLSKSKTEFIPETDVYMIYSVRNSNTSQNRSQRNSDLDITQAYSPHSADGEMLRILIGIRSGKVITTPITVYPLICLPSVTDILYEPYHEDVDTCKANNSAIAPVIDQDTAPYTIPQGKHFMHNGQFCTAKTAIASGATFVENSNYVVKKVSDSIEDLYSNIGILPTPVPDYVANSLPVLKRDITNDFYSGTLRSEIAAGDFRNVRPGDYIVGSATGTIYYVTCCDWMFNKGDQTNAAAQEGAYGTHHLGLMIYKAIPSNRMWAGYGNQDKSWRVSANDKGRCPWNAAADVDPTDTEAIGSNSTNISRTYNGASVSGYMGSFIRERIDTILLPECFQADFGSANVLKFRNINGKEVTTDKPSGGQSNWNGLTTAWEWYDRFLDLPSEIELYGSRIFGAAYDIGVQCEQLPLFRNASINAFFPRQDIWTKAVASRSYASRRYSAGTAGNDNASCANWACPLACIK